MAALCRCGSRNQKLDYLYMIDLTSPYNYRDVGSLYILKFTCLCVINYGDRLVTFNRIKKRC